MVTGWIFLSTRTEQVFVGLCLLLMGTLIFPLFSGWLLRMSIGMNEHVFGSLASWQIFGFAVLRGFSAVVCGVFAAYGAVFLSVAAAASSGLIKAPWS